MSKISSLFTTILGVLGCSAAVALQPTVRAGSLSLNSAVKPTAGNVTSTVATQSTATLDASRGSALSKFSPAVVPVSRTNNNNNQNVNSEVLDELRQQIAELTAAQNNLRDNQLSRSDVEDTVEDAVKGLNLTTANTDLKNTLSDLQSSNQSLQRSIDDLTNRTEDLEDTENGAVVNILKVRGLINPNNTVPFALKTEIEPTALAQKIVTDASATATLADKIQPKDTDIRDIITDELTEVGVLKNGALDVEKKGEVQVTEATVTNALRNSSNFKQMVSDEIATKGYVTTTALNDRGFVTNDALNNKKFLSTDSVAFSKLATKDEIAPAAIAASIADSESAKQVLSGKIGPDESSVKGLITGELQRLQIVDGANTLKVATTAQVDPVSIATSIADNETAKAKLSGKIGPDESSVKGLIFDELKKRDIVDASDNLKLATASDVSVESLTDKLDDVFAGKNEVPTIDEKTVSAALANSTTLDDTIIRNLKNKRLLKDSGDLNVATNDSVSTLSSRVAVLDGGINDNGSLLNTIAKDETLKELLRGKDGKDGTSYKLKGSVETYENLVKNNVTQISDVVEGDGYFTQDTGKLYVYNCDSSGNNCKFPAEKDGIELKGEKGDPGDPGVSAETTWHSYCTTDNNLNNIIKPLYGTSKTCDNFTEEEYIALMDGSKAYCMLVAKNAKENSNYLVATKGIGKTLEDVFGSGTVSNLKNNGLSASVSINGTSKKFVFACAEKYDEIMNPKSAWYSYCSEGTNLTSIIQPLYGASTVKTCDDFTQEQYNAIMGGPKAYCLMVAKNVDSSTTNVKNNLKRLFGDTIVSTLSSQKVTTKVTLNNQTISFVDACAQKYEEIMAGKSGEGYLYRGTIDNYSELSGKSCDAEHEADAYYNLEVGDALLYICACNDDKTSCSFPAKGKGVNFKGEPGENGKPASQIYCEAHAVNYPSDVTNLTLIQKLYPDRGISSCDPSVFTQDLYAAIIGGANAYCTSLNATFNTGVSLNDGVGLKLAKIYATKKSVSLSSAKDALRTLQTKNAKERMNDSNFSILDECIANYNSIMSGEDAEKPEVTYCKAEAEHYKDGTLNRDLARKLFPNATISDDCSDFTAEMYAKMVGGADAFCANLTATFEKVSLDDGVGLKMAKLYLQNNKSDTVKDLNSAKTAMRSALITNKTAAQRLNIKAFGGKSLLEACIANYNSIMSGDDGETAWYAYCTEEDDNGVSNLTKIITPLYSNVTSCEQFTSDMYNAIQGGAKSYCLSLVKKVDTLDLNAGIGQKLVRTFGNEKMQNLKATSTVQGRLAMTGFKASSTRTNTTFMEACEARYNEIMSGTSTEQQYCEDNLEIVKKLYSKITSKEDCADKFTNADYTAIMGGSTAYCLSLVQNPTVLNLTEGIGKRMAAKLGSAKMAAFVDTTTYATPQARMAITGFAGKSSNNANFMTACKERYDEIMAGDDGESAAYTWCKAHVVATGFRTAQTVKKMSAAKTLNAFTARGNVATDLTKSGNEGYFTSMNACLAAVEADPSLMGGETAEEAKYNSDVAAGEVAFEISTIGKTAFNQRKANFVNSIKGAPGANGINGINGVDGKTFRPSFDANGNIVFTQSNDTSSASLNFVDGIRGVLSGGDSTKAAYGTASLEDAIAAIAAKVAFNVSKEVSKEVSSEMSKQVSEAVSRDISSKISDRVTKRIINNSDIITGARLTNASVSDGVINTCGSISGGKSGDYGMCQTTSNLFSNVPEASTDSNVTADISMSNIRNNVNTALASNATLNNMNIYSVAGITKNTSVSCSTSQYLNNGICMSCGTGATSTGGSATTCSCSNGFTWTTNGCACSGDNKYVDNGQCKALPSNATRTTDGFICNAGYYKNSAGTACNSCGTNATSNAGSTSCSCNDASYTWSATSTSGQCTVDYTQLAADCKANSGKYWANNTCNDVPANATQSGNGTSFSCNANYYKSGNSCLTCGSGATSNAGATTCTCTASGYEWSTTSNGGTCTQTCAQKINNICVNGESDCNKISGYEWNGDKCVQATTTCEKPNVYVGEKFGTCKTCGDFGLPYIAELGSCCTENTYLYLGEEKPTCRSCPDDTTYDKKTATCVCKDGKASFDASTGKCE